MAWTWMADRQLRVLSPLQRRDSGSKLQCRVSKIMPSLTPSSASHVFRRPSTTNWRSESDRAWAVNGWPCASVGAAALSETVTQRVEGLLKTCDALDGVKDGMIFD